MPAFGLGCQKASAKGPGEQRGAQPSACTYKEPEMRTGKSSFHISPSTAGGLGGSRSPPKGTWALSKGSLGAEHRASFQLVLQPPPAQPAGCSASLAGRCILMPWYPAHPDGRKAAPFTCPPPAGSEPQPPARRGGFLFCGQGQTALATTTRHGRVCTKACGVAESTPVSGVATPGHGGCQRRG